MRPGQGTADLLPIAERLRYLRVVRAVLAAAVLFDAALFPASLRQPFTTVAVLALGYLVLTASAELVWRGSHRRHLWLFGGLLLVDGAFLGAATFATGGGQSGVRYLVLVHAAAVTVLASYRSGVKLAAWHSLVQTVVFYAVRADVLDGTHAGAGGEGRLPLVAFLAGLWILLLTVASLAAVNERELRRRRFELEQLAQLSSRLEASTDRLSVGASLVGVLGETFDFTRMALFDVAGQSPRLLAFRNLDDALVHDFPVTDESVLLEARRQRHTLLVSELDVEADAWLASLMPDAQNLLVAPLIADSVIAVLVAETGRPRGARIERRIVATTERFAGHAALALRTADLLDQLQQLAVTDSLTGLSNRRAFDDTLERELSRSTRGDSRLSVILLDVDHFKQLNDTHGHVVGDIVLRQVAEVLRDCGREYDTIARYGGEEFAAVLPGCSQGLALQVAERLRRAVAEGDTTVPVTVSAGVATFPYDGIDASGLLTAADTALYASKHAGRNRVSARRTPPEAPPLAAPTLETGAGAAP